MIQDIKKDISGVYLIQCAKNGRGYIGSAKCIKTRWSQHLASLERDIHHSFALQDDFNKYGKEEFSFKILRECTYADSKKYETEYIEIFNTNKFGYNVKDFKENTNKKWKKYILKTYDYVKHNGYIPDGKLYWFNLFDTAKELNITPTEFLKQFGVNSYKTWSKSYNVGNDNYVGIEFDNHDGLQVIAFHKTYLEKSWNEKEQIKCFQTEMDL